ncbi:MAG: Ig-like domain-containing protein, partial [bacterium]
PGSRTVRIIIKYDDTTFILDSSLTINFDSPNTSFNIAKYDAEPDTIFFNDKSEITVHLINKDSIPISGKQVEFELTDTTFGDISDTSAISDNDGVARINFISRKAPGTVKIKFNSGGIYRSLSITILSGEGKAAAIMLYNENVERTSIGVKGAGDITTSRLTFTVETKTGRPITLENKVQIKFSIIQGPGGGCYLSDTLLYTDVSGQASTVLNSGIYSGNVIIKAELIDTALSIVVDKVAIHGGPPDKNHFHIVSSRLNIWGWDYVGDTTTISAQVADRYGNPVPDGWLVNFWTTGGMIVGSAPTDSGVASVKLIGQGSKTIDPRVSPDSTDYAPLRDDLDLRHKLFPADSAYKDSSRSVGYNKDGSFGRYILYNDLVKVNPLFTWRPDTEAKDSVKTGDGQAIVFASVGNDSSIYGCDSCESNLIWDECRVVFSGKPYGPYKTTINGVETTYAQLPDMGSASIGFFLTDPNGNPLVGGTKIEVETDLEDVKIGRYIDDMPDAQAGLEYWSVNITDTKQRTTDTLPASDTAMSSRIQGLAPKPAEIRGQTSQSKFVFGEVAARVTANARTYGSGLVGNGDTLLLLIDSQTDTIKVPFDSTDTSLTEIRGALGRAIFQYGTVVDNDSVISLESHQRGSSAFVEVINSPAAAALGFSAGRVFGEDPDSLFVEVNGILDTVTFLPADDTLSMIIARINQSINSIFAAFQTVDGTNYITLKTVLSGASSSLRLMQSSAASDLGLSPINLLITGEDAKELVVIVNGGIPDTVQFSTSDTTVEDVMGTISFGISGINVGESGGKIVLSTINRGPSQSIRVDENCSANRIFNFPYGTFYGKLPEGVSSSGSVYVTTTHPGGKFTFYLCTLMFE